jgi:hypothetical protein
LSNSTDLTISIKASRPLPTMTARGTTEASDKPLSAAIDARDQCVASLGVRSSVATITASI